MNDWPPPTPAPPAQRMPPAQPPRPQVWRSRISDPRQCATSPNSAAAVLRHLLADAGRMGYRVGTITDQGAIMFWRQMQHHPHSVSPLARVMVVAQWVERSGSLFIAEHVFSTPPTVTVQGCNLVDLAAQGVEATLALTSWERHATPWPYPAILGVALLHQGDMIVLEESRPDQQPYR